jgi:hypothetical protein
MQEPIDINLGNLELTDYAYRSASHNSKRAIGNEGYGKYC